MKQFWKKIDLISQRGENVLPSNILYFTLIISQHTKKNTYKFTYITKKTKMPSEGQKQEQVPLQMATQATMYYKYTKNSKLKV